VLVAPPNRSAARPSLRAGLLVAYYFKRHSASKSHPRCEGQLFEQELFQDGLEPALSGNVEWLPAGTGGIKAVDVNARDHDGGRNRQGGRDQRHSRGKWPGG